MRESGKGEGGWGCVGGVFRCCCCVMERGKGRGVLYCDEGGGWIRTAHMYVGDLVCWRQGRGKGLFASLRECNVHAERENVRSAGPAWGRLEV
jgi:hypothetical protein